MTRRWILTVLGLFAGCTATPPEPGPPPALRRPIPEDFAALSGKAPSGPVVQQWWSTFGDARLEGFVREALVHNHDLAAAAARVTAAVSQAKIAGAELTPRLDVDLNGTRQRQNFIGFPIPGSSGGALTRTYEQFGVALRTSWEIDLWGRVRSSASAAVAELQASGAEAAALRESVAAQTAKAYFAVLEAHLQTELAARTEELFALTTEQVELRVARGVNPALDLRLARANLDSSRAAHAAQRERLARTRRQLQLLLGRYPDGALPAATELPPLPPPPPVDQPASLLQRRPDVIAAERRLAATGARIDAARAALFPRLSLTASGGTSSADLSDLLDTDFRVWSIGGNLLQPLWNNGLLREDLARARARAEEAAAAYAQVALASYTEVETALAAEHWLRQRLASAAAAEREAVAARGLAEDRYRRGLSDLLTVLEAQRRALDAAVQNISVRRLILDNRVDLHLGLGGAFQPSTTAEAS